MRSAPTPPREGSWPALATIPSGPRAAIAAAVARRLFVAAVRRLDVTNRADFREALSTLKDFDGATGKTSFDEKREARKPLVLLSVDNKGVTEVKEDKTAALGGS